MDLLMISILPILGIMSVLFLIKQRIKKFHVYLEPVEMKVMGCNIFPLLHLLMAVMPDSMRRQAITKQVNILGGGISCWNILATYSQHWGSTLSVAIYGRKGGSN